MIVRTELSGCGHYGVCTIVPRDVLEKLMESFVHLSSSANTDWDNWSNLDLDPWKPFGINGSWRFLTKDDQESEVRLAWDPGHLGDALISQNMLMRFASIVSDGKETKAGANLEICTGRMSEGWFAQANLGDDIWKVIESSDFPNLLPKINADIRHWWEDQSAS